MRSTYGTYMRLVFLLAQPPAQELGAAEALLQPEVAAHGDLVFLPGLVGMGMLIPLLLLLLLLMGPCHASSLPTP